MLLFVFPYRKDGNINFTLSARLHFVRIYKMFIENRTVNSLTLFLTAHELIVIAKYSLHICLNHKIDKIVVFLLLAIYVPTLNNEMFHV